MAFSALNGLMNSMPQSNQYNPSFMINKSGGGGFLNNFLQGATGGLQNQMMFNQLMQQPNNPFNPAPQMQANPFQDLLLQFLMNMQQNQQPQQGMESGYRNFSSGEYAPLLQRNAELKGNKPINPYTYNPNPTPKPAEKTWGNTFGGFLQNLSPFLGVAGQATGNPLLGLIGSGVSNAVGGYFNPQEAQ